MDLSFSREPEAVRLGQEAGKRYTHWGVLSRGKEGSIFRLTDEYHYDIILIERRSP
jgi:hypothetical protein